MATVRKNITTLTCNTSLKELAPTLLFNIRERLSYQDISYLIHVDLRSFF